MIKFIGLFCEVCGLGFDFKSRDETHIQTSKHKRRAKIATCSDNESDNELESFTHEAPRESELILQSCSSDSDGSLKKMP